MKKIAMLDRLRSVDPAGKFRFFKLLSIGGKFYNCDFYEHVNERSEPVYNVKVECPDKSIIVVQLASKESWLPVKAYPDIGDEMIAKMNAVINHHDQGRK